MSFKQYLASPVMVLGSFNIITIVGGIVLLGFMMPLLLIPISPACIMLLCITVKEMSGVYKKIVA